MDSESTILRVAKHISVFQNESLTIEHLGKKFPLFGHRQGLRPRIGQKSLFLFRTHGISLVFRKG